VVTTMFGEWGNDEIEPLLAADVVVATALTDTVYVLFTNAVVRRDRLPAATWSSVWYLLSSIAVSLCCRRDGFLHRRLRYHDLSASRPNLSAPAGRIGAPLNGDDDQSSAAKRGIFTRRMKLPSASRIERMRCRTNHRFPTALAFARSRARLQTRLPCR
jgi:hypothetical protein